VAAAQKVPTPQDSVRYSESESCGKAETPVTVMLLKMFVGGFLLSSPLS